MINIKLSVDSVKSFVSEDQIHNFQDKISLAHQALLKKTAAGNEFLGWVNLPSSIEESLLDDILLHAKTISQKAEIYVVIGIGGSYLGARAVIEALQHHFSLMISGTFPQIIYAGQNISEDYLADLMQVLDKKDYAVSVISKSGTTTEPALAFRLIKNHLENKYGKAEASKRIIAITDEKRGALKTLADNEGYKTYVIPDNVGGRYSVLTPVGLLPIAVAGYDIKKLVAGAKEMESFLKSNTSIDTNQAMLYAAVRNALSFQGKSTEILVNYEPRLHYLSEWWKQLYGESEGKVGKGIFPASVSNTTDLHSMGQYIQEGARNIFETVLSIENSHQTLNIPEDEENLDGLNYLCSKSITEVNQGAEEATRQAHVDGGVPNLRISIPKIDEENMGQLLYFFEFACGLSGYTLGVNPFDQPGVEAYKNNMFAILGKPGF
ncbi:MAG: glucose-6-phosphate isomerase [Bacteroidales bacterium]|jgi:glucose-6-phosphate isomerase|nr:glucose-6-phosphate isomerase [Bacteroidales bacterium]